MDAQSLLKLNELYPPIKDAALLTIREIERITGRVFRVTHGLRDFELQSRLYAQGRTTSGPDVSPERPLGRTVTDAEPGFSRHNYGLAFDVALVGLDPYGDKLPTDERERLWEAFARAGEANGLHAGRRFPKVDSAHMEGRPGRVPTYELRWLFAHGGMVKVWTRLDALRGVPIGHDWNDAMRKKLSLA